VLHSWGSAMTHHPHIHMIVPGGGISLDGERWVSCREVLSSSQQKSGESRHQLTY
jgi:predicted nucleic acid-binding Zn ribbon protein